MSESDALYPSGLVVDAKRHLLNLRFDISLGIVAYVLLVYDYFLTLDMEATYVWPAPWSFGSILFYLNRYIPLLNVVVMGHVKAFEMSMKSCQVLGPTIIWLTTVMLLVSQTIIALRTYAIWGRQRVIFYILIVWAIIFPGTLIVVVSISTNQLLRAFHRLPSTSVRMKCPTSIGVKYTGAFIFHIATLVSEIVIVVLTGIKARQHMRKFSPQWVNQLYQNGILQCFSMLAFSIANTVMIIYGPEELQMSMLPLQCNLHSIFCNRVILLLWKNSRAAERWRREGGTMTHDIGTMYIFNTVHSNPGEFMMNRHAAETPQTRSLELEWVR